MTDLNTADGMKEALAKMRFHAAKTALGEQGPVWWSDGAPDYNRHIVVNTPYADWYATLSDTEA